ncbi:hypothetical protein KC343_g9550 [Hortaea werneckii]|uniref:Uncharacterized protein n=1 Tax=Hortaea werneckii TaxID=91943 RepID=A0A3M7CV11_HORWE|nr:hypothetical protein KC352_g24284 [Hortaea werneckii]KAI7567166.1 hypothetical protein KC317_g5171 [Hortaea werneckii]KAI7617106.1 hypothetical protein KC343_g9550 [Hortaea werneckii]KAI7618862.1 hypothetical protein KC346_g4816 [Hortaea werneckii]KAI7641600.1 hypothetical protein KC319_g13427 [Hortaea werneckii]
MAAALSPLTDILPPEVRIRIYKEVLRADRPLVIARREYPEEVRFNNSLLFVCKIIFFEASDVFLEVNTIHLRRHSELNRLLKVDKRFRSDLRFLQNIRYLGLVEDPSELMHSWYGQWITKKGAKTHIEICLALPKLKECTFIYGPLKQPTQYHWLDSEMPSIKEYLGAAKLDHEYVPECVDVGVWALRRSEGPTLKFVYKWLAAAWAQVKSQGQINVAHEYSRMLAQGTYTDAFEFYVFRAGPAIWCTLYDNTRTGKVEDSRAMRDLRVEFRRRIMKIPMLRYHAKLPHDLPLRDVSSETVDPDVIEWLCKLLLHARGSSDALSRLQDVI